MRPANRPFEGQALADLLKELATICVIADSLRYDLDPLSEEDVKAGAEPLTNKDIQKELEKIPNIVTQIALFKIRAEREEWYAANDSIE